MNEWQGTQKYYDKTCPSNAMSTTDLTRLNPGSNPGSRDEKPANSRLGSTTAFLNHNLHTNISWNGFNYHEIKWRISYFSFYCIFGDNGTVFALNSTLFLDICNIEHTLIVLCWSSELFVTVYKCCSAGGWWYLVPSLTQWYNEVLIATREEGVRNRKRKKRRKKK